MFNCVYDECPIALAEGYVCAEHRCKTDACKNVKKIGYDMCEQHISNDAKYDDYKLLQRFDESERIPKPIIVRYPDGGIVHCTLVRPSQYTCGVCYEETLEIIKCNNNHTLCRRCYLSIISTRPFNGCPTCRVKFFTNDDHTASIARNMLKKCKNDRCHFEAFPSKLSTHLCQFDTIKCFECTGITTPHDLQAHFETECLHVFREVLFSNVTCIIKNKNMFCTIFCNIKSTNIYIKKFTDVLSIFVINLREKADISFQIEYGNHSPENIKVVPIMNLSDILTGNIHIISIPNITPKDMETFSIRPVQYLY